MITFDMSCEPASKRKPCSKKSPYHRCNRAYNRLNPLHSAREAPKSMVRHVRLASILESEMPQRDRQKLFCMRLVGIGPSLRNNRERWRYDMSKVAD